MIHDTVIDKVSGSVAHDRRRSRRVPCPAELTILWHHSPSAAVRYRMVDASEGGFSIRSSLPVTQGTTGMALKLLPEGAPIEKPVMVAWSRQFSEDEGYVVGLKFF